MTPTRTSIFCASNEEGIFAWSLEGGRCSEPSLAAGGLKSFFLAFHPRLPVLYSVDIGRGIISAFAVEPEGRLRLLHEVESEGAAPCHLEVDASGRLLMVANYNGDPAIFALDAGGRLSPAAATLHLEGSGPDAKRQEGSHPHGITFAPEGGYAYVTDLGVDRVAVVTVAEGTFALEEDAARSVRTRPGAGPRHFALAPGAGLAAVVNELDNTVTTYRRDRGTGTLTAVNTLSTLPADFTSTSYTAEIAFHPTAPVCYATNRGHDSVAVFGFDPQSGALQPPRCVPSGGKTPQHLSIDPAGNTLFVANTASRDVTLFRLEDGFPAEEISRVSIPAPMCVLPVPPRG